MGLIAKETGGGNFETCPPGTFQARCYMIADLGTQVINWQGTQKMQRKVVIAWELEEKMNDGRPFAISKQYTLSLSEKAQLRKDLDAWRGRPFTGDELEGFDLFNVLDAQCFLNIIHEEKNGKTYTNISSVMALPKRTTPLEAVNPVVAFSLEPEDYLDVTLDSLPKWIQEKIKQSPEYQAIAPAFNQGPAHHEADDMPPMEDDIPF